ncbi:MAG: hypothetical protein IPM81_17415 [Saprospirales bacterium]|nr:hypothetical protein [Saprospirales bacterium]
MPESPIPKPWQRDRLGQLDLDFRPGWADATGENATDSEPNAAGQQEKFYNPQYSLKPLKKKEKKEEERPSAEAEDVLFQSAKPTEPG